MSKAAELAALIGSQTAQGNKNLVINGSMKVSQRATSSTGLGAASSYPTLDRFQLVNSSTNSGRLTMSQDATTDLVGFGNAMKFDCTTADTSIAADEVSILRYSFEGQDLQSLGYNSVSAKSVTISFYVKGNAAATYTFELQEPENGRTIAQEFSVTTSWSRVQLTFPGDTGGSLSNDNSERFRLHIFLHAGSNYTGGTFAGNSWISTVTNTRVGDNQTSFFDSTNRTFFITGLQMEIGDVATAFEHEDFGTTLIKCKRYYEHSYAYGTSAGTATTSGMSGGGITAVANAGHAVRHRIRFDQVKCKAPTMTAFDSAGNSGKCNMPDTSTNVGQNFFDITTISFTAENNGVTSTDSRHYLHYVADAEL